MVCWGRYTEAPDGEFTELSAGYDHICGLRTDGTIACWGFDYEGNLDAPEGRFTAVAVSVKDGAHSCGIRTDRSVACWGPNDHGQANPPAGQFTALALFRQTSCATRTEGVAVCWGQRGLVPPPDGVRWAT